MSLINPVVTKKGQRIPKFSVLFILSGSLTLPLSDAYVLSVCLYVVLFAVFGYDIRFAEVLSDSADKLMGLVSLACKQDYVALL